MKKYTKFILGIIFGLFIFVNPIKAYSTDFVSDEIVDYQELINKETFIDIEKYDDNKLIIEDKKDGSKVYYKEFYNKDTGEFRRYGEWFKQQDSYWFNYQESIENGYKTNKEFFLEDIIIGTYRFDKEKCQSNSEFINNNCQSKIKLSILAEYNVGTRKAFSMELLYPNNPYVKDDTYSKYIFKADNSDMLENSFIIDVKRNKNNKITNVKQIFFDNNKKYLVRESYKIDNRGDLYDVNNLMVSGEKNYSYDEKEKLRTIDTYLYSFDYDLVNIYQKRINYYSNGNIATSSVEKRFSNNQRYYLTKIKYNKKKIKQGFIKYKFNKGKVTGRSEYVYNSKGNLKGKAYKYFTSYKKGKRFKTVKYFYNNKQKIYKKIKCTHRSDFTVPYFELYDDDFWFFEEMMLHKL